MKRPITNLLVLSALFCFFLATPGCKKEGANNPPVIDNPPKDDSTATNPPQADTIITTSPLVVLPEREAKIYLGLSGMWDDMLDPNNYGKWEYVRGHVTGFYISFIAMWKRVYQHPHIEQDLIAMNKAFPTHRSFFETSMETKVNSSPNGGNNEETDKKYIDLLMDAGFSVDYASLNYGIDAQRVKTLRTYKGKRKCLALLAPWQISGDINSPERGVEYQSRILSTDGMETDGPLGLWYVNLKKMVEGSYSLSKFALENDKISAIMLAPYDSDAPGYNQLTDYLNVAKSCVFGHEDHDVSPDIWTLWEYGADKDLPAFPEAVTNSFGKVETVNTRMGVAYWLLKHLNNLPRIDVNTGTIAGVVKVEKENDSTTVVTLSKRKDGTIQYTLPVLISNDTDPAIEISPVIRGTISGENNDWNISFKAGNDEVTDDIIYNGGLNCVNNLRVSKTNKLTLNLDMENIHPALLPSTDTVTIETVSNISNTGNKGKYRIIIKAL